MKKLFFIFALTFVFISSANAEMLMKVDLIKGLTLKQSIKETQLKQEYDICAQKNNRKSFWYLIQTYNQMHRIEKQGWLWVPISYEAEKTIRKIFKKEQFDSIGIKDIKLF